MKIENPKTYCQSQFMKLKTKIPKVSECQVSRERLLTWLDNTRKEVIIFQAAAGFGKTAIMAEWAGKYERYSSWYRVNESDNNPYFFIQGLKRVFSSVLKKEILNGQTFISSVEEDIVDEYEIFLEEVVSFLPDREIYICFDDFDLITNKLIYEFIQQIIEFGAGKIRILFAIRGSIPSFLASFFLHREAELIGPKELCFSKQETGILLNRLIGAKQTEQTIIDIHEYTQGWPAGVVFAGLSLKTVLEPNKWYCLFDETHLYKYIFHEIFQKISWKMQEYMISIAVFDTIDPLVCNYVFEQSNSIKILDYLVQENLFLYPIRGENKKYRYLTVFACFLRNRIEESTQICILLKASEYFMHQKKWKEAVRYAVSCGKKGYAIVSEVLKIRLFPMIEEGEEETLEAWIAYLEEGREELQEKTLFLIYCFYRCKQLEKDAIYMLYQAAERAYCGENYELYAEYMYELITYCKRIRGMMCAKEYTMEAKKRLLGKVTSYNSRIVCYHVEFCLQLEDKEQMETFLQTCSNKEKRRIYHFEDIKKIVQWAVNLEKDLLNWKEVIEESRFAARISRVYAEYGFYRVVFFLYWKGNGNWMELAAEGVRIGGESVFFQWMKLLLLLEDYKGITSNRDEIENRIKELEKYRIELGIEFPNFKSEDRKNLESILSIKKEDTTRPEKKGSISLLKIICLGNFSVEGKIGEVVWRTRKTKELFACLFFEEGRGVEKDILMERLWPDTEVKKASTLFHTTVSYLRKALASAGALEILNVKNGAYAIKMERVSSDIHFLLKLNHSVDDDKEIKTETINWVLELYHGCYMHGEDYRWLGAYREYVEQIYIQTLGGLAVRKIGNKEYGKAVLLLQKAVDIDCYAVSIWELLVETLILSGDMIGAKKQFKKMEKICLEELEQELGMEFQDYVERSQKLSC